MVNSNNTGVERQMRVPDFAGNPGLTPVAKTWLSTPFMDVLIEGVRWGDVQAKFARLPPATAPAVRPLPLDRWGWLAQLPAPSPSPSAGQAIGVATADYHPTGVVLDYINVLSSVNYDYTFDTGNTYFVSSTTYFSATVTFNPGCITKFNGNYLLIYGSIVCNGTSGSPSIFTDYHDSLFGDSSMPGALAACPTPSASPALWDYYINAHLVISQMRFRFTHTAIEFDANDCNYSHDVSGCTFEECETGIFANNCSVAISASTRSDVSTPTAGTPIGCYSFSGALTDVGNVDSDGNFLMDWQDYKYFGRLGTLPGNVTGQAFAWSFGFSPSTAQPIWSTRDDANAVYVYNGMCWLQGVKGLTAFSPWNSTENNHRGGTLITPRHAVLASHASITNGSVVRFVGSDNTTYSRTCLASADLSADSDYMVMVLDNDLPPSVGYVRILPWEAVNKMTPSMSVDDQSQCLSGVVPGVGFNQRKEAFVIDLTLLRHSPTSTGSAQHSSWLPGWGSYCYRTQSCTRCGGTSDIMYGDSGSPFFLIINSELVLIGPWWQCTDSGETATWQADRLSDLNQTIANLDTQVGHWTGYSATVFPVGGFPSLW